MAPQQVEDAVLAELARMAPDAGGVTTRPQVLKITLLRPNEHYSVGDAQYFYEVTTWAVDWRGTVEDCFGPDDCVVREGGSFILEDSTGDVRGWGYDEP